MLSMHSSGTAFKIWYFYLYQFCRYKTLNIHHIGTDQFPINTFLDSGDLKTYISGEISTNKILTENITFITYFSGNGSKKAPSRKCF